LPRVIGRIRNQARGLLEQRHRGGEVANAQIFDSEIRAQVTVVGIFCAALREFANRGFVIAASVARRALPITESVFFEGGLRSSLMGTVPAVECRSVRGIITRCGRAGLLRTKLRRFPCTQQVACIGRDGQV
jgi:hypothetical protein